MLSTIPGPANLGPIVREFCRREGVVTAFADSAIKMLAGLMQEGSANEAIPFGSLARRFASICGELPLPIAHEGHAVAAIGVACEDLPPESPFSLTAHRQGLHKAIQKTLHELSAYGLEADEYESVAAKSDPLLAAKLTSLAHVEREAADTLRQLGRSFSREHYRTCIEGVPEKGASLGRVLVLSGSEFNPEAIGLLKWAASHGAQVQIVAYRHPESDALFKGAERTKAALGIESEDVGSANELLKHLFTETESDQSDLKCTVASAADSLAETEWALRGCLDRHESGMPFDQMALYVRDSASYAPLVEASSKRLGVPVMMWRRTPLLTNSFARITQAALEFCASNDVRSLMPMARTTYVDLDFEARLELQTALKEAHSARGEQWGRMRDWVSEREEQFHWLKRMLNWRAEAVSNPALLEIWIGKLRELMMILPPEEGALGGRERDKRAQYVLQQSLNQIASVRRLRGPRSMTLAEFARAAKAVWAEADVSVPAGESGVLVTSQAEALPRLRCLFVLGMLEGVFPRRRTEDPIVSDFEREAISALRGSEQAALPVSRDKAEGERDEFYTVCAAASDEIVFSYPETDEERDNVPAFYLDEVERALGGISKVFHPREEVTPPLQDCLALSDREIRAAMSSEERAEPMPLRFSNPHTAKALSRNPVEGLEPRELREALQCPFSYFAHQTLGIRPDRLRSRWFSLVRLPKAAGLSDADSPEKAKAELDKALDEQLDELYSDIQDWEIALLRSGGRRLIREWVEREFTARNIWPREEVRTNVRFGEEGLRDVLPRITKLSGGVAATSRLGPYSVVHLVETSGPAKGYGLGPNDLSNQDKLYYGLHLLAAWDKTSAGALEIETMAGERLLMLLPRFAHVNLTARVQEGLKVVDLGGVEETGGTRAFFDDVKKLAREAAKRIEETDVRAVRGDHCAWCDYGELCRRSFEFGEEDSPFVDDL
ncbi:MAG: PD-(D/E)XK nuclease family protein [Fimbriimonadales bacterium]